MCVHSCIAHSCESVLLPLFFTQALHISSQKAIVLAALGECEYCGFQWLPPCSGPTTAAHHLSGTECLGYIGCPTVDIYCYRISRLSAVDLSVCGCGHCCKQEAMSNTGGASEGTGTFSFNGGEMVCVGTEVSRIQIASTQSNSMLSPLQIGGSAQRSASGTLDSGTRGRSPTRGLGSILQGPGFEPLPKDVPVMPGCHEAFVGVASMPPPARTERPVFPEPAIPALMNASSGEGSTDPSMLPSPLQFVELPCHQFSSDDSWGRVERKEFTRPSTTNLMAPAREIPVTVPLNMNSVAPAREIPMASTGDLTAHCAPSMSIQDLLAIYGNKDRRPAMTTMSSRKSSVSGQRRDNGATASGLASTGGQLSESDGLSNAPRAKQLMPVAKRRARSSPAQPTVDLGQIPDEWSTYVWVLAGG